MPEQPTLKRSMNLLVLTFYGLGTIIGAGIMPSLEQIETMWVDILDWLNTRPQSEQQAGL